LTACLVDVGPPKEALYPIYIDNIFKNLDHVLTGTENLRLNQRSVRVEYARINVPAGILSAFIPGETLGPFA
jgi:hypothetical protein